MTAVVGVLNKHAVAIAADSAVTIGNGKGVKIFNGANKIFSLSKYHPIAILIYNSASFMGTPWETIIKVYRQQLGDRSFGTVDEYQKDFLDFLRVKNFFDITNNSLDEVRRTLGIIVNRLLKDLLQENNDYSGLSPAEIPNKASSDLVDKIKNYIEFFTKNSRKLPDFESFELSEFSSDYVKYFNECLDGSPSKDKFVFSEDLINLFVELYFELYTREQSFSNEYTGLIFTGFGEEEIFPQLLPIKISFVLSNKLRYFVDEDASAVIGKGLDGAICPFAQVDVIDTILQGIDPQFEETINQNFEKAFKKYNLLLAGIVRNKDEDLAKQIEGIDIQSLMSSILETNEEYKRLKHIEPLMNAVETLSKEDLAEMAESLIYLTYLKRRITFAEESVGGPVDVAIISKGDGMVWIKRKHYFDPKLNTNFFKNYLR